MYEGRAEDQSETAVVSTWNKDLMGGTRLKKIGLRSQHSNQLLPLTDMRILARKIFARDTEPQISNRIVTVMSGHEGQAVLIRRHRLAVFVGVNMMIVQSRTRDHPLLDT